MHTTIGPCLEELGPIAEPYVDFVRLAGLVYLVDRTTPRNKGFERELELTVPVFDPDGWNAHAEVLAAHLRLLSSDAWALNFVRARNPRKRPAGPAHDADLVLLFSGGADSLCGALVAQADGRQPLLASHWDFSVIGGVQNRLAAELEDFWNNPVARRQIQFGRRTRQIGSGKAFRPEGSSRSRSLLFLALGLAIASVNDSDLWMAENGFASLNVPLTGERRAALSTRTTHPGFLRALSETLRQIGLRVPLSNPFESLSKGEVYEHAAEKVGRGDAERLLSASHSCAKPDRGPNYSAETHCGACFGCLVRRAAFTSSELDDKTTYIEEDLRGSPERDARLGGGWKATYEAVRARVVRGVDMTDILSLGLPADYDLDSALRVARAGISELGLIHIP